MGSVYTRVSGHGGMKTCTPYPGFNKFSEGGGEATKENLIYFIEPDADTQFDWFVPNTASGFDAGGAFKNKSVNQSACLLHFGSASQRA